MKDVILFKLIAKQKTLIPIILLISMAMGLLHRNIGSLYLVNVFWAISLSGLTVILNHRGLINWRNKSLTQKVKEGILILLGSFLILLIPNTFIVIIGLFFIQIYFVTVLSESGDELTPFIKSSMPMVKLSDAERNSFNIRQKLNYPEPDSEMDLAITQNELKIQEILKVKKDLEKNIVNKENEIDKIQKEMVNNSDYQYAQSLKETIHQSKKEKESLLNKRSELIIEKQSIEKQLKIQQIKLEQKQKETEELSEERDKLKETLIDKEKSIREEISQKESLELEQKKLKEKLNETNQQIKELKSSSVEVDDYKKRFQRLELEKKELESLYLVNENQIIILAEKVIRFEEDYAKTKQALDDKEKELNNYKKENEKLFNDYMIIKGERKKINNDLSEYKQLLSYSDKEHALRKKELEKKQNEIERMSKQNADLEGQLEFFKTEYKELQKAEQQNKLIYLTRLEGRKTTKSKNTPSVMAEVEERFKELYPDLTFEKYFYNQFKTLDKDEQFEIERKLIYLNYGLKDKYKIRKKTVPVPKGSAVQEIEFKIRDQKKVGKGRLYAKNGHIYALSRDDKEQYRVTQKIRSGELGEQTPTL